MEWGNVTIPIRPTKRQVEELSEELDMSYSEVVQNAVADAYRDIIGDDSELQIRPQDLIQSDGSGGDEEKTHYKSAQGWSEENYEPEEEPEFRI